MKQSKLTSLFKSLVSTGVGFVVAFFANMLILPWFGLEISHSANLLLTAVYTVISIVRGYVLERLFEALGWRQRISPFMSAVIAERFRQVDGEGWSLEHDDTHRRGELANAAFAHCGIKTSIGTPRASANCRHCAGVPRRTPFSSAEMVLWPMSVFISPR